MNLKADQTGMILPSVLSLPFFPSDNISLMLGFLKCGFYEDRYPFLKLDPISSLHIYFLTQAPHAQDHTTLTLTRLQAG